MIFPPYSFVQDGAAADNTCYPDPKACLPSSGIHNLSFQAAVVIPLSSLLTFAESTIYLSSVPPDFDCSVRTQDFSAGTTTPLNHLVLMTYGAAEISPYGDDYQIARMWFNTWNNDYATCTEANNAIAMPPGTCFKLVLVGDTYAAGLLTQRTYYGCTNCFVVVPVGECYTSALAYSNPVNAFGFDYSDAPAGYVNKVELPCYLRDPVLESEQKVYTRSDGTLVKLFERKEERYELETDQMPYLWHRALDIALSHDSVSIQNANASGFDPLHTAMQFVKKGAYEVEYNKAPLSAFGKGKCTLSNALPLSLINNNCA